MKRKHIFVKKGCYCRGMLSGIYNACRYLKKEKTLLNKCVEDPRYRPSGMTRNLIPLTRPTGILSLEGRGQRVVSFAPLREKVGGARMRGHLSGFTLIELLVVVLIIGILAAVAVPQYQKAVVKSRLSTLKSLVATVSNAAEVYYLAHGSYPKTLSELDVDIPASISATYDEENSIDIATYPWGFCYLSNILFQCNNTQVNIAYIQRFLHIYVRPGARSCSALENNATAIAVCKQETGQTSYYYQGPTTTNTTVESYQYQ